MGKLRPRKNKRPNPGLHCPSGKPTIRPQRGARAALLPGRQGMWESCPLASELGVGVTAEVGRARQVPGEPGAGAPPLRSGLSLGAPAAPLRTGARTPRRRRKLCYKGVGVLKKYLRTCSPWFRGPRPPPLGASRRLARRSPRADSTGRGPPARRALKQRKPRAPAAGHAPRRPRPGPAPPAGPAPGAAGRAWGERARPISGRATASRGPAPAPPHPHRAVRVAPRGAAEGRGYSRTPALNPPRADVRRVTGGHVPPSPRVRPKGLRGLRGAGPGVGQGWPSPPPRVSTALSRSALRENETSTFPCIDGDK